MSVYTFHLKATLPACELIKMLNRIYSVFRLTQMMIVAVLAFGILTHTQASNVTEETRTPDERLANDLDAAKAIYEKILRQVMEIEKAHEKLEKERNPDLEVRSEKPMPEWMRSLVKRIAGICMLNLRSDTRGSCNFRISPDSGIAHLRTVQHFKEGPYRKHQSINLWNVYEFEVDKSYSNERFFLWLRCLDGPDCEDWYVSSPSYEKAPKRFGFYVKTRMEAQEIEATIRQIRDRLKRACPPKQDLNSLIKGVTEGFVTERWQASRLVKLPENILLTDKGKEKLSFHSARRDAFKDRRNFLQSCAERK